MLVVEDDARLRLQLARHFRVAGWVVEEAGRGADARYLAAQFPYDMVIVDLGLPDQSGIDLITGYRFSLSPQGA